ncbi:FecR domain-containing protein [Paenibacillus aestuarii]|uniref:FecR domain-containing protein n=1 Tax=Paenibacillus aestuarii TaxID=516965 RepID=A0ABW0KG51_9BACL|nr:FecR domain-containing protein [Paenibacillus aestuarii]
MQVARKIISLCLSCCLLFSLLSMALAKPVDAKTVRVAAITSLSGQVTVKKGGGSQVYDAYLDMSLNQGDTIMTGADASVKLDLSNGDADITLGANAEVNVSDLNTSGGSKKSKLKIWAGALWVKVKSLVGSDDEFEVETPTAVMGVRGTQFFVGVDPVTGQIKMAVGAGKVSASTVTTGSDNRQTVQITYLYPTQQIALDARDEVQDLSLKVQMVDLAAFIQSASPEVIKAIIENKAAIDKENDAFIANKRKELESGGLVPDGTSLYAPDLAALDKVKANLDNLVGNIAKQAVSSSKISKADMDKLVAQTNGKMSPTDRKLVLDDVQDLDKTAGVDPELEKRKQEALKKLEAEKLAKQTAEQQKLAELKKQLEAQLKAAEEAKQKAEEASKKAEAEAKAKAEAELKKSMSDIEKKAYDEAKNGGSTAPVTGGGSGGSSGGGGNDPGTPAKPAPSVTLSRSSTGSNNFNLNVQMSDFGTEHALYAVEVHLQYAQRLHGQQYGIYTSVGQNKEVTVSHEGSGRIFQTDTSVESAYDYTTNDTSANVANHELIYTVTNFGSGSSEISFSGTKTLVSIPFSFYGPVAEDALKTMKVGYIKLVKKDGSEAATVTVVPLNIQG